ncbi:MAG: ABC transporter substrate-binding protein [Planctomycetes bacterium]|nr:ABC transporter substrate-binding protein [Planctomycetota bacterium]
MRRQARSLQAPNAFESAIALDLLVLVGALLAFLLFGCAPAAPRPIPPGSGPILLGEFHSLTGPLAARGRALHDGFLLAIEEQNARGGVHGRPIEVRTFDDRGITSEMRVAVRRLLDEDRAVLIAGGTTPDAVDEAAAESGGAPYVAPFGAGLAGSAANAPRVGCSAEKAPAGELDLAFVASWRARHGAAKPDADAAAGYDMGRVACRALERAVTFDPHDLWDALLAVHVTDGARGLEIGAHAYARSTVLRERNAGARRPLESERSTR